MVTQAPMTSSSPPTSPSVQGPKRMGIPGRLGLVALGLILSLGLVEIGLRVAGMEFHMHPVKLEFGYPDPQVMEDYFSPHPQYLWAPKGYADRAAQARDQAPYLVFSGCSCTAWGRFAQPLAKRVKKHPGAEPLNFINMACAGWSSFSGLQQMKHDIIDVAPKVMTIYFGWNDHWVGYGVNDKTAGKLASSSLLQNQDLRIVQLLTRLRVSKERQVADDGQRPIRVSLADFRSNIEEMVDLAHANKIQPVLMTAPTSHQIGHEPEYLRGRWIENLDELVPLHQSYVDVVREIAAEKQVVLCDLANIFEQFPREELDTYLMKDGIHFTPEGGKKVGALLFECLRDNELLPMAQDS